MLRVPTLLRAAQVFRRNRAISGFFRLFDKLAGPTWHCTPEGLRLRIFLSSPQDLAFFWPGSNCLLRERIAGLRAGGCFVDVGANIGYYSLLASQRVGISGQVIAFEPSQREYRRLVSNRAANGASNILTLNSALGDSADFLNLAVDLSHTGINHLLNASPPAQGAEKVMTLSLDSIFFDMRLSIDLVKIDVEGWELKVLHGANRLLSEARISALLVEITPAFLMRSGDSREALYAFMEERGYFPKVNKADCVQYDELFVRATGAPIAGDKGS